MTTFGHCFFSFILGEMSFIEKVCRASGVNTIRFVVGIIEPVVTDYTTMSNGSLSEVRSALQFSSPLEWNISNMHNEFLLLMKVCSHYGL